MSPRIFFLQLPAQLFLAFLPVIFNLNFSISSGQELVFHRAFESWNFKLILSSCIAVTIPLFIEIIRDFFFLHLNAVAYRALINNLIMVLTLLLPDVIIFTCVIPGRNIALFACIHQFRVLTVMSAAYGYLHIYGGPYFQQKKGAIWYVVGSLGHHLTLWQAFTSGPSLVMHYVANGFIFLAAVAFAPVAHYWFLNQFRIITSKSRAITTEEYYCNVYLISFILCIAGLGGVWILVGTPDFCHFSSPIIIGHNVIYGLFYILISVFHQGIVLQNLIAEVRIFMIRLIFVVEVMKEFYTLFRHVFYRRVRPITALYKNNFTPLVCLK